MAEQEACTTPAQGVPRILHEALEPVRNTRMETGPASLPARQLPEWPEGRGPVLLDGPWCAVPTSRCRPRSGRGATGSWSSPTSRARRVSTLPTTRHRRANGTIDDRAHHADVVLSQGPAAEAASTRLGRRARRSWRLVRGPGVRGGWLLRPAVRRPQRDSRRTGTVASRCRAVHRSSQRRGCPVGRRR